MTYDDDDDDDDDDNDDDDDDDDDNDGDDDRRLAETMIPQCSLIRSRPTAELQYEGRGRSP